MGKAASSPLQTNDMASKSEPEATGVTYRRYPRFDAQLNGVDEDDVLESPGQIQDTITRLQQLYDQGVPFFSKSVIRGVVTQLDDGHANPRPANGPNPHVISIPSVNGTVNKSKLETGHAETSCFTISEQEDVEFVKYGFLPPPPSNYLSP
jgi:hypothetical protein